MQIERLCYKGTFTRLEVFARNQWKLRVAGWNVRKTRDDAKQNFLRRIFRVFTIAQLAQCQPVNISFFRIRLRETEALLRHRQRAKAFTCCCENRVHCIG
jgi:hypothetical protein